jgi:D-glycero-D-manno-heptose 1,7-bisphosphate phosphatase
MTAESEVRGYLPPGTAIASTPLRKVVFLDRDGVININHGYVHTPAETEWVPGVFDFCRAAQGAGYGLVVVTNQAGIARGYYSEDAFLDYTRWVHAQFAEQGVTLLATFYCPHHPTAGVGAWQVDCGCRKPKPGMIVEACRRLGLDAGRSMLVGDQPSDIEAAHAGGVPRAFLIDAVRSNPFERALAALDD